MKILNCRRSILSIIAIGCLTYLGLKNGTDVSVAIAGIVAAVASSNAYQARGKE